MQWVGGKFGAHSAHANVIGSNWLIGSVIWIDVWLCSRIYTYMPLMKKKLTPQVISENVTITVKSLSNLLMISVGFFFSWSIIWFYEPSRSIAFFMNIVQYLTLGIVYFLSIVIYLNGLLRFLQKMFVFNFLVPCEIFGTEICYLPWTLIILLNVYLVQSVSRPKGGIW